MLLIRLEYDKDIAFVLVFKKEKNKNFGLREKTKKQKNKNKIKIKKRKKKKKKKVIQITLSWKLHPFQIIVEQWINNWRMGVRCETLTSKYVFSFHTDCQ